MGPGGGTHHRSGLDPKAVSPKAVRMFSDIVDLHVQDMQEVGKPIGRSKRAVLESLKIALGSYKVEERNRAALIEFGKKRAKAGAGPSTLAIDLFSVGTLLTHAAAWWDDQTSGIAGRHNRS